MTREDPSHEPLELRVPALVDELPAPVVALAPSYSRTPSYDEKSDFKSQPDTKDSSVELEETEVDGLYDENGRDRVLETAEDFSKGLVSLQDDPTLPIYTFRMWFIGLGLAVFAAVLGMLFQFRPQVILVSALFLQIIAYMLGRLFEEIIPGPGSRWHRGNWFWNWMNPGPFNLKEHVAAQIMANSAANAAQACFIFAADDLFYDIHVNGGNAIFTLLASQLIGYGLAGMFRSMLVYPTIMLYPIDLIYVNLFDVLHRDKGKMLQGKRFKFFWILTATIFVYEWFPEYIAPLLGSFNIVCLIVRNSNWISYIFGGAETNEGMGMLGFGVDWANITSQPFYTPLSTQISNYVGWLMNYIILPLVFANNVWNAQNFPFISQNLFFENGTIYEQELILNADQSLNMTAYEIVGQPWMSSSQVIYYIGINLSLGATFTHMGLWYGKELWGAFMDFIHRRPIEDVHYKKMAIYKEVPLWWYLIVTICAFITAMVCCYTEKSDLPWWALIVGLILAFFCMPFYCGLYAVSAFVPYIAYLMDILASALIPGSSQANMYFELYSSQTLVQASYFLADLKLGQYTKLPPRVTFWVQMAGTSMGAVLNYVIMQTVVNNERTILLSTEGTRTWSGQQIQSYNANAVLWGALGKEIFGPGGPYFIVPLCIVIGLALPVIPWAMYKKFGWNWLKLINMAVMSYYIGDLAGGTNGYIWTWMAVGLFSHFYLRRYRSGWFRKYNYLLGAAVDGGSQLFVFVYSFSVGGAGGRTVDFPTWALNPAGNADYCKLTDQEA